MLIRAALAVLALALPAAAQEIEGNIFTGVSGGAELAIGQDIAALAAECGLTLNVQESAGGVENMLAVRERRLTQFGLVQSDVLEYFRTFQADDPEIARAAEGIRVALPLYDEEVQVLARRDVAGLAELSGRRVATGAEGSGTALTAGLVLDLAEVAPAERLALAPAEALDALLAGEIDALFHVGGAPAALFADARIDPAAFHLLPLTDPVLAALYAPAELAAGTYPFVTEPVPVVAVKSVLVTFDFDPRRERLPGGELPDGRRRQPPDRDAASTGCARPGTRSGGRSMQPPFRRAGRCRAACCRGLTPPIPSPACGRTAAWSGREWRTRPRTGSSSSGSAPGSAAEGRGCPGDRSGLCPQVPARQGNSPVESFPGRSPEPMAKAKGGAAWTAGANPGAGAPGGRGIAAAPRRGVRGRICRRPNPAGGTASARHQAAL